MAKQPQGTRDARIDAYIERANPVFQPMMASLRETVHRHCPDVEEAVKWGMPTFLHRGKILCAMAAFKQHMSFGYWQHAEVIGAETSRDGMGSYGKMRGPADMPKAATLKTDIRKTMALIDDAVGCRSAQAQGGEEGQACTADARRFRRGAGTQAEGAEAFRCVPARPATRIHRVDRRGQARRHPLAPHRPSRRMVGRGQETQLEIRELLRPLGVSRSRSLGCCIHAQHRIPQVVAVVGGMALVEEVESCFW